MSSRHRITLAGIEFIPDLSGALYSPAHKTLLLADLHLEQGTSLARRGIHVPPFDTHVTLSQLESLLSEIKPARLILLGDSFHDDAAPDTIDGSMKQRLAAVTGATETIWITGNHDPSPHDQFGGACVGEYELGPITLRHIPQKKLGRTFEIAGHLHPGATIIQRGVAARAKCFVADTRRLILPAFGAYTGAVNIRSKAFAGLFDETSACAFTLGKVMHKFPYGRCS